uniref:Uncharacterized protein n=1 Tax=Avena sativa TaxID=4498 RepID=A0ACD5Z596_AVESA
MFTGAHLTFDVSCCTEFVVPVKFETTWSTYVWDFVARKVFILNPSMNNGDHSDKVVQSRHRAVARELHGAIGECIGTFFRGWEPNMSNWDPVFPKGLTSAVCESYNSGVYSLHFARHWMGAGLKKHLMPVGDAVAHSRMNLLVDSLSIKGNIGHVPAKYRACIQPS